VHARRTIITTASVSFSALVAILGLWQSVEVDACARPDLDLAHCQTASADG
jgi:hypothetical protein